MAVQRTFSILKPDVTRRNLTGAVNQRIEAAGLRIVAQKRVHMTRAQAETFYGVHRERPFFGELVEMMTAAPVVVQVLEGEDAIQRYRVVMGATNPETADAERFYDVHAGKPFFGELVGFMTSGPVVVQVLEGEGAVARYREVMGATNPEQAAEGTIRKLYALSVGENSVHGSDSQENAAIEIAQFFKPEEIVG